MTTEARPGIRFEIRGALAIATLDREPALNSLNLEMARALLAQLEQWAHDKAIRLVVLRGSGPRAFCAGGDVKAVCLGLRADEETHAREYFEAEYRLDHAIHRFPKPLVAIGHGYVMGGGIGLFAGAAVRVVTESSQLSMPEVSIGFFPDVGASFFLNRLPGRLGLFLALTAARMNAGDALAGGLADVFVPDAAIESFVDSLAGAASSGQIRDAAARAARAADAAPPLPRLTPQLALIDAALAGDDAHVAIARLWTLTSSGNPILADAARASRAGSPTSSLVIWEQLRRARGLPLADCFRLDLGMAVQFARHHDFREGVRALLIDKDQAPRWSPADLAGVDNALVRAHFDAPFPAAAHPLRDL